MQQPTLPGCLHEIAPEPRGPGGWLHRDGDEAQVLIRDDCELEPPLSRLNGMTLRLPVSASSIAALSLALGLDLDYKRVRRRDVGAHVP